MSEFRSCSLCGRSESKVDKLFSMPGGFSICSDCMQRTMDQMPPLGMDSAFRAFSGMPFEPDHMEAAGPVPPENVNENCLDDENEILEGVVDDEPSGEDDDEKEDKADNKGQSLGSIFGNMPNVQFLNFSDLQGLMRPQTAVKKKKKKENTVPPILDIKDIPKPHILKERLDEYVVGQDYAKKVMSVAVYNHYKRILGDKPIENAIKDETTENGAVETKEAGPFDGIEIEKSNMLMVGPTGCGKTYLVRTLAKLLNVPLAITDATSLTEAGYIGDDIESVVSKLLAEADNDVERAEQGIIFIDEIDKIAKKHNSKARDVSGESVQQGMLKLLEGSDIEVPVGASSKNAMVPMVTVNTRNILFICGGAFPDLDEIIKKRLTKKSSIGYSATLKDAFDKEKNILSKVEPEDLREFGMIPEFLGRLPIVFSLDDLTDEMMAKILTEPKNALIKQYQRLLDMDEVKLEFTDDALLAIAKKAQEKDTGARALRAIIEGIMLDIMYEIPKDDNIGTVTVTKDYVNGIGGPQIGMRG